MDCLRVQLHFQIVVLFYVSVVVLAEPMVALELTVVPFVYCSELPWLRSEAQTQ